MASGCASGRAQKRGQVARDGGIGNVRQAELAEEAALLFLRLVLQLAERQEAFEREFQRFLAQDLGSQRAADQPRAGAEDGDLDLLQLRIGQQSLFGRRALAAKRAALPEGERCSRACVSTSQASVRSRLSPPSSRCLPTAVRVNSTRSPSRWTLIRVKSLVPPPTSQTSTIWPSNRALLRLREVIRDPGVERGGRLFEEREVLNARLLRRLHGQLARLFVERCGHGEHDVLRAERLAFLRSPTPGGSAARYCAETSTGDRTRPASCASQGRIFAVRSTSGFDSHDFAEWTVLVGTSAPCSRA